MGFAGRSQGSYSLPDVSLGPRKPACRVGEASFRPETRNQVCQPRRRAGGRVSPVSRAGGESGPPGGGQRKSDTTVFPGPSPAEVGPRVWSVARRGRRVEPAARGQGQGSAAPRPYPAGPASPESRSSHVPWEAETLIVLCLLVRNASLPPPPIPFSAGSPASTSVFPCWARGAWASGLWLDVAALGAGSGRRSKLLGRRGVAVLGASGYARPACPGVTSRRASPRVPGPRL